MVFVSRPGNVEHLLKCTVCRAQHTLPRRHHEDVIRSRLAAVHRLEYSRAGYMGAGPVRWQPDGTAVCGIHCPNHSRAPRQWDAELSAAEAREVLREADREGSGAGEPVAERLIQHSESLIAWAAITLMTSRHPSQFSQNRTTGLPRNATRLLDTTSVPITAPQNPGKPQHHLLSQHPRLCRVGAGQGDRERDVGDALRQISAAVLGSDAVRASCSASRPLSTAESTASSRTSSAASSPELTRSIAANWCTVGRGTSCSPVRPACSASSWVFATAQRAA